MDFGIGINVEDVHRRLAQGRVEARRNDVLIFSRIKSGVAQGDREICVLNTQKIISHRHQDALAHLVIVECERAELSGEVRARQSRAVRRLVVHQNPTC